MKSNMSKTDRSIRAVVGLIFIALYGMGLVSSTLGIILAVVGVVFLITAAVAFCPMYVPLKIKTNK
jgi:hypothetical protein